MSRPRPAGRDDKPWARGSTAFSIPLGIVNGSPLIDALGFGKMPVAAFKSPLHARLMARPGQARFRAVDSTDQVAVDLPRGLINGVSLLTANREALGWSMWVDAQTVALFATLLKGRKLKGYATHGAWDSDGTLDEVGLWLNARVEGDNLRADFSALDAWREFSKAEFATLFELATKAPDEFGASLRFAYTLAWVRQNGEDVPTAMCGWNCEDDCPMFDPSAPADAVRSDFPSVRPVKVMSADFVDEPAANEGLFHAGPVDAPANGIPPVSTPPASLMDIKTLKAEFGSKPIQLARAVDLFSANDKLTVAELRATIQTEEQSAELSTLRTEHGSLKADLGKVEKAGFKAAGDKSAVDVLLSEHATFKARDAGLTTAEAALKTAGFEAKEGKTALELALAALSKARADIATLRAGGTPAVDTGTKPGEGGGLTKTRAEFSALKPADRLQFSKSGGKIVDPSNN
jgi:hypothetical protein